MKVGDLALELLSAVYSELKQNFKPRKRLTSYLADSYKRLGVGYENKFYSVNGCGDFLAFSSGKLHNADFCRDRLCPMCSWRKTLKIGGQMSQIVEKAVENYDFIFLTLTVPNCSGSDLDKTVSRMYNAWARLRKRVFFNDAVRGYFKSLEITRNLNKRSKSYKTYHPHFHVILAVEKNYFTSKNYIKRETWLNAWRDVYGDMSITQVDVRRCYSKDSSKAGYKSLSSAVVECAKYAVKPSSYLGTVDKKGNFTSYDSTIVDESVDTLCFALKYRRVFEMRGIFRTIFKELEMDDAETGDLVIVGSDADAESEQEAEQEIYYYRWSKSDNEYVLFRIYKAGELEHDSDYVPPPPERRKNGKEMKLFA